MNLSEPRPAANAEPSRADVAAAPAALAAELGREVASALSTALDRVADLNATGRIDRAGLRALHAEVEHARRAAIMAQQIVRLDATALELAHERLDLAALLREALRQRGREIEQRRIELRQQFGAAEVLGDGTLLFSLLQAMLDWSFEHAVSRIDYTLAVRSWPPHAVIGVRFAHRVVDELDPDAPPQAGGDGALDTMSWRLLQRLAAMLALPLQRRDRADGTELSVEFSETLPPRVPAASDPDDTRAAVTDSALAGRHVLVLAARRDVRSVVREALRSLGVLIDFAASVDEALQFCSSRPPDAVVYDAALAGGALDALRAATKTAAPHLAFVEVAESGRSFELRNSAGAQLVSVGRDGAIEALATALAFELARRG